MPRSLFLLMEKSGMDVKSGIFTVFSLKLSRVSSCGSVPLIRTHTRSQVGKGELGHFVCIPSFYQISRRFRRKYDSHLCLFPGSGRVGPLGFFLSFYRECGTENDIKNVC